MSVGNPIDINQYNIATLKFAVSGSIPLLQCASLYSPMVVSDKVTCTLDLLWRVSDVIALRWQQRTTPQTAFKPYSGTGLVTLAKKRQPTRTSRLPKFLFFCWYVLRPHRPLGEAVAAITCLYSVFYVLPNNTTVTTSCFAHEHYTAKRDIFKEIRKSFLGPSPCKL